MREMNDLVRSSFVIGCIIYTLRKHSLPYVLCTYSQLIKHQPTVKYCLYEVLKVTGANDEGYKNLMSLYI